MSRETLLFTAAFTLYYLVSHLIFTKVLETSSEVIDELFHIRQGLAYCNENYSYWDAKITTLPGLYLVSSTILTPFFHCNVANLRYINVVASCINFYLFYEILSFIYNQRNVKTLCVALNLAILPPLYFFSFLYYTETLSVLFLLAFTLSYLMKSHWFFILITGFLSVLMRQTNIVWIAVVLGHKLVEILIRSSELPYRAANKTIHTYLDLFNALNYHFNTYFLDFFKNLFKKDCKLVLTLMFLILSFISFVIINGSIVVGDKTTHEASIHIPQVLYFLLFYGAFGFPHVLNKLKSTLHLIYSNKLVFFVLTSIFLLIVHFNTVVHPYMLADNRHYTFYIWNRWFGRYWFAKYVTVLAYSFLLFSLYDNLSPLNSISFLLPFCVCAFVVLSLQRMIEVRYFLVPYIILRLRFQWSKWYVIFAEFILYFMLNYASLYVFFTKEIYWKDFEHAQQIIW